MDPMCDENDLNDNSKLELKVLRALSRIQRKAKTSGKWGKGASASVKQIVKHLKAVYALLDGDIETQVITALLHCVKNGWVCALDNNRYLLLGARAKSLVNKCVSRTVHGKLCICAQKTGSTCCILSGSDEEQASGKKPKKKKKCSRSLSPNVDPCEPDIVGTIVCDYCLEIHPGFHKKKKETPPRKYFTAPADKFSPRDECTLSYDNNDPDTDNNNNNCNTSCK